MQEVLAQIPALESHPAYKGCVERISELEQRLEEARNEAASLGDGPLPSVEPDGDLDDAVAKHLKATEAYEKQRIRAALKTSSIERQLRIEREKIPELRAQAEDMVGRRGAELHQKAVEDLYRLKREMSDAMTSAQAIRHKVRYEINKQTIGYRGAQFEERYCWGPNHADILPAAVAETVISQAIQAGHAQFNHAVHQPAVKNFREITNRFEAVLKRFVS